MATQICENTVVASATAGVIAFMREIIFNQFDEHNKQRSYKLLDVLYLCNSMLAGMVSVSASCDRINTWSAILIGFLSQILYSSSK